MRLPKPRLPQLSTPALLKVAAVVVPLSLLLSAAANVVAWAAQEETEEQADRLAAETEANERLRCEAANEGRATIRDIAVDVGTESAEAIIEIATADAEDPPEPAVIEAYRAATQRRMEAIASQLEDRDCEAEARERAEE